MRHPVLPQCNPAGTPARHGAQPVMRVREMQSGARPGEPGGRLEQHPARTRQIDRGAEKSTAESKIGTVRSQGVDQPCNILCPMLTIGVERDTFF